MTKKPSLPPTMPSKGGKVTTTAVAKAASDNGRKAPKKIIPPPAESEEDEEDLDDDDDDDEEEATQEEDDDSDDDDNEDDNEEDEDSEGFEVQSSSEDSLSNEEEDDEDSDPSDEELEEAAKANSNKEKKITAIEKKPRQWSTAPTTTASTETNNDNNQRYQQLLQQYMHVDDLSSDDEDAAGNNTVGRVPLHWYDAFDHIGYSLDGTKLAKRSGKDRIDLALEARDDPLAMRKVYDMYNDREVILSERDMEIIRRIQAGAFAHPEFNDTPDYVDYYTHEQEIMPLSAAPEPKSRFLPSKWELKKVMQIVKAMQDGKYVSLKDKQKAKLGDTTDDFLPFLMWKDEEDEILAESKRYKYHLPAPKMPLPGHAESYNPPEEYLLTETEKASEEAKDPEDRLYRNFYPTKYSCLRHVPGYEHLVRERFERCLDLYLCPRKLKKRLNIDPETLIPTLPAPRDLKPFPNSLCMQYLGHEGSAVRCLTISPDGQYLVSGDEAGNVKLWEVSSGYCRHSWSLGRGAITALAWNPDAMHHLVAVSTGKSVFLVTTGTGDKESEEMTETHLETLLHLAKTNHHHPSNSNNQEEEEDSVSSSDEEDDEKHQNSMNDKKSTTHWTVCHASSSPPATTTPSSSHKQVGPRLELVLPADVTQLSWHHKGDYLAVLSPKAGRQSVSVHQISKGSSQYPFNKSPSSALQSLAFHPFLPCLVIVSQQHVKLFHLIEQKLIKKLLSGCKWLSSLDIHPSGDHILVGSYDRRVVWFDLDLASTPYKTLKFHEKAVRDVKFHKRYPLMASASDDGSVHIFHGMVYSDLMRNPLIVPLKILKGHGVIGQLGVLSVLFHPRQPWIFTAGADGVINLYQDL